ncbi:YolD-like family protein [Bacillus massiliglaciei]|uniref:YolD-like family protein n=1 Tax=Bacillus massiliglaciei TaxID=1816693 RepID=UPI000DA63911|nr:YolD-like family protein [Bacillus massiliglaciei]
MSEHLRRGNKLWESHRMFLPEHKQALMDRRLKQKEFQQPGLDQDQFEKLNRIIAESIQSDQSITITYSDLYGPAQFWGWITKINLQEKWLKIINDEDALILRFERILDAE